MEPNDEEIMEPYDEEFDKRYAVSIELCNEEEYEQFINSVKSLAERDYKSVLFICNYYPGLFGEKKLCETFENISIKLKEEVTKDGSIDGEKLCSLIRDYPVLLMANRYGWYSLLKKAQRCKGEAGCECHSLLKEASQYGCYHFDWILEEFVKIIRESIISGSSKELREAMKGFRIGHRMKDYESCFQTWWLVNFHRRFDVNEEGRMIPREKPLSPYEAIKKVAKIKYSSRAIDPERQVMRDLAKVKEFFRMLQVKYNLS